MESEAIITRNVPPSPIFVMNPVGTGAAAAVVLGGNQRGPLVWRTEDGSQTYRDWQEEKLKQARVKFAGG